MHNPILKNIIGEKPLSERELEIGNLLAAGLSDNEIASKLSITPDTVKFHLKNIYKKMGINGRRGLLKSILSIVISTKTCSKNILHYKRNI